MKKLLILGLLGATLASAAPEPAPREPVNFDKAIARGIAFLVSKQHTNGVIVVSPPPAEQYPHAMTSLSIMAMIAVGTQPTDDTPAGRALRKALEYMVDPKRQDATGYFGGDGSAMYGHGICTLMLAEVAGMGIDARQDALIRERCQKAVDLIIRSQKVTKAPHLKGGWRYAPSSADSDLSVTVWQVMALRAAKNAGLVVPKETIDEAVAYIKRSYSSPRDKEGRITNLKSGFAYQPGGPPSYSTACEGLLALQVCGDYDAPELNGTVEWLRDFKGKNASVGWFYYGTYYYAQGMYQRGGDTAKEARLFVENLMLAEQKPVGHWQGSGVEASDVYGTAMALLSLSVRYHFMPIYQH